MLPASSAARKSLIQKRLDSVVHVAEAAFLMLRLSFVAGSTVHRFPLSMRSTEEPLGAAETKPTIKQVKSVAGQKTGLPYSTKHTGMTPVVAETNAFTTLLRK